MPQHTHTHTASLRSANCSLLFCVSPSSCFPPLQRDLPAPAPALCTFACEQTHTSRDASKAHLALRTPPHPPPPPKPCPPPCAAWLVHRCHPALSRDRERPLRNSAPELRSSYGAVDVSNVHRPPHAAIKSAPEPHPVLCHPRLLEAVLHKAVVGIMLPFSVE